MFKLSHLLSCPMAKVKSPPSSLRQGTLGFSSAKRTTSASSIKGKKAAAAAPRKVSSTESSGRSDEEPIEEFSSKEESIEPPAKKQKKLRVFGSKDATMNASEGKSEVAVPKNENREDLDVHIKSGKWKKHFGAVRQKMGNMRPSK
jgi:DNA polymerase delta subunit 4